MAWVIKNWIFGFLFCYFLESTTPWLKIKQVTKHSTTPDYIFKNNTKVTWWGFFSIPEYFFNFHTSMIWRNLSSEGGWVACKIRQMCWVSSSDTSSRSPIIIRSSNWAFAPGDSSNTGGSKLRGTSGLFRGCFLGVLEPFRQEVSCIRTKGRDQNQRKLHIFYKSNLRREAIASKKHGHTFIFQTLGN